jgi:hypothetical protein
MANSKIEIGPLRREQINSLDPVGSILWEALGQGETPTHACEQILARYDVDRETVERDLRQFIGELAEGDLIVAA